MISVVKNVKEENCRTTWCEQKKGKIPHEKTRF